MVRPFFFSQAGASPVREKKSDCYRFIKLLICPLHHLLTMVCCLRFNTINILCLSILLLLRSSSLYSHINCFIVLSCWGVKFSSLVVRFAALSVIVFCACKFMVRVIKKQQSSNFISVSFRY